MTTQPLSQIFINIYPPQKLLFFTQPHNWVHSAAAVELRDSRVGELISKLLLGRVSWIYKYSWDRSLDRDSAPASCCPGITACWLSWPKGIGIPMLLGGSQNTYVTGIIHVERSVHRKNVISENKLWWKLRTMDYLAAEWRERGCITLRHCIIQLYKFAYFLFPNACILYQNLELSYNLSIYMQYSNI